MNWLNYNSIGFDMNMLAEMVYDGQLSTSAYAVLAFMILFLMGGFSWCFYRAIKATDNSPVEQLPDEE